MADDNNNPEQKRIADLSQEQLGVSQAQFGKINAQNEALGAVILELAASQAQQEEIEKRQIKREKFYRRRDFIFNQIVAQFQRISAKKAAIQAENQFNRDLIEQEAQADAGISIAKNTNMLTTLTEFMQRDIARLSDFMIGNKLAEEENRREFLAALKDNDGIGRREFKEKKYQGFLKTLGKVLLGVPFFLIGFFEGYFGSLGKTLKTLGRGGKWIDKKVFSGFFGGLINSVKDSVKNIIGRISGFFVGIKESIKGKFKVNGKQKKAIDSVKNIIGRISGFFVSIKESLTKSSWFQKFKTFASRAKNLGKIFGKIFYPLQVLIGVFSFVKGFMKGYDEGGIIEGIKQGVTSLYDALIGSLLELLASAGAAILNFFGLNNLADSLEESMGMLNDGIKGVFSGVVDLVKGIFTLDGDLIGEALGQIWDGVVDILLAGPNLFMGLLKDIFGAENVDAFTSKIQEVYDKIIDYLSGPLNKIKKWLGFKTIATEEENKEERKNLEEAIKTEEERIKRSLEGDNEYLGRESKGIEKSRAKIAEYKKQLGLVNTQMGLDALGNTDGMSAAEIVAALKDAQAVPAQNGAEMAALEKENADLKAQSNGGSPTIINNNYQVDNSQTNTATTFHQGNMMDEGLVAVGG